MATAADWESAFESAPTLVRANNIAGIILSAGSPEQIFNIVDQWITLNESFKVIEAMQTVLLTNDFREAVSDADGKHKLCFFYPSVIYALIHKFNVRVEARLPKGVVFRFGRASDPNFIRGEYVLPGADNMRLKVSSIQDMNLYFTSAINRWLMAEKVELSITFPTTRDV